MRKINIAKLKFIFFCSSLLLGIFCGILLFVADIQNQMPQKRLLIQILLGAFIFFPAFICAIAILDWYVKFVKSTKLYQIIENDLVRIGFKPEIIDLETKWRFAQHVFSLQVAEQKIILVRDRHYKHPIKLLLADSENVRLMNVSIAEFRQIDEQALRHYFGISSDGLKKEISVLAQNPSPD